MLVKLLSNLPMDFDFILFAYWKILSIFSTLSISYRFSSCNTAPMFCIFSVNVWCHYMYVKWFHNLDIRENPRSKLSVSRSLQKSKIFTRIWDMMDVWYYMMRKTTKQATYWYRIFTFIWHMFTFRFLSSLSLHVLLLGLVYNVVNFDCRIMIILLVKSNMLVHQPTLSFILL
jgi:hypothetical protein